MSMIESLFRKKIDPVNLFRGYVGMYPVAIAAFRAGHPDFDRVFRDGGTFWIGKTGEDGWVLGQNLRAIAAGAEGLRSFRGLEDCTEWFWQEYEKLGYCLLDPHHENAWKERFDQKGKWKRRCRWCGAEHRRKLNWVVKIERFEEWE